MSNPSGEYLSQGENAAVLRDVTGQHQSNIIGNVEDEEFAAGIEDLQLGSNNKAL